MLMCVAMISAVFFCLFGGFFNQKNRFELGLAVLFSISYDNNKRKHVHTQMATIVKIDFKEKFQAQKVYLNIRPSTAICRLPIKLGEF